MPLYWLCPVSAVLNCPHFLNVLYSTLWVSFQAGEGAGAGEAEERLTPRACGSATRTGSCEVTGANMTSQHDQYRQMVLVSQAWLGRCRWGAHISREDRVSWLRQACRQLQPLHHNFFVLPAHSLVMPLHQGGVAHIHQLQGGLLHNSPIGQNAPPDFPVVLQDEIPSGHCASAPLPGTAVDGTEPDKDGLNQTAAIWPLGKWGSGGECMSLHTLHPWSKLLPLLTVGDRNLPMFSLLWCLAANTTLCLS